jgi:hypothetical protein
MVKYGFLHPKPRRVRKFLVLYNFLSQYNKMKKSKYQTRGSWVCILLRVVVFALVRLTKK